MFKKKSPKEKRIMKLKREYEICIAKIGLFAPKTKKRLFKEDELEDVSLEQIDKLEKNKKRAIEIRQELSQLENE